MCGIVLPILPFALVPGSRSCIRRRPAIIGSRPAIIAQLPSQDLGHAFIAAPPSSAPRHHRPAPMLIHPPLTDSTPRHSIVDHPDILPHRALPSTTHTPRTPRSPSMEGVSPALAPLPRNCLRKSRMRDAPWPPSTRPARRPLSPPPLRQPPIERQPPSRAGWAGA
jgi:hypothetical protein